MKIFEKPELDVVELVTENITTNVESTGDADEDA